MLIPKLFQIYCTLLGGGTIGWLLGRWASPQLPIILGRVLFWVGVPLSVFVFLRQTRLEGAVWAAGGVAWWGSAVALLAVKLWLRRGDRGWSWGTQGTAMIGVAFGNTGYLGLPIALTLFGQTGFAWALFYDLLGTTLGAYGGGAWLAQRYSQRQNPTATPAHPIANLGSAVINPTLVAFGGALLYRQPFPEPVEVGLSAIAWGSIMLALLLIGIRLSEIQSLKQPTRILGILLGKMLLLPMLVWLLTRALPLPAVAKQILVLQSAMPPAFATIVLTENYQLDPELAVSLVAGGCICLLVTLPLWLLVCGYG
ncbi:MAG: hypothetical protein RLZZ511_504 [Cyanobacteriota bacterium]|jgi:malate permease and related proteins